jgi:hypothetical protein
VLDSTVNDVPLLPSGKKGYTASLPVSEEVKPGAMRQFLVRVASDKSALFKLKYHANALGKIALGEQSLSLDVFIPRSGAGQGEPSATYFPQLPAATWKSLPESSTIFKVVYRPDDRSDVRILLNTTYDKIASCDPYYASLVKNLPKADFPSAVTILIVDSSGREFCQSPSMSLLASS